ncbi:RHS repeat-associated core domain-containing protein [Caulobacter sp. NIBR1757]|uniref:RHS repeat-associated core domain-containing protein n=1 Tax=Caulobacter sp. NIBR1757 TaxID=3016000 RepID=UPI0022F00C20|nr:RHS repeat-associated core domain-containing protein [Caulobacter sp. NIBR1757]
MADTDDLKIGPLIAASVYDPTNRLNQYPKVDTKTFTYRTDGPMTYDGVRNFAYDERRNLTLARQGVLTAGNYEQDLYDALGARWYSARAAATIADTRRVELTDGLRPEVAVEEMINIPEGTTDQDAAGGRFSVMGPNPDERLTWIDATAAALQVRNVHASRRGDARILSKGGAPERTYTYSAFGESSDNVTGYPWRFTGQRFNSWTGLYHFKARAYSPALGRFMQPDPIGYDDGPNMYSYVSNSPFESADPTGTSEVEITLTPTVRPARRGPPIRGMKARERFTSRARTADTTVTIIRPGGIRTFATIKGDAAYNIHSQRALTALMTELTGCCLKSIEKPLDDRHLRFTPANHARDGDRISLDWFSEKGKLPGKSKYAGLPAWRDPTSGYWIQENEGPEHGGSQWKLYSKKGVRLYSVNERGTLTRE